MRWHDIWRSSVAVLVPAAVTYGVWAGLILLGLVPFVAMMLSVVGVFVPLALWLVHLLDIDERRPSERRMATKGRRR